MVQRFAGSGKDASGIPRVQVPAVVMEATDYWKGPLAACFERGAVTSCFVATPEFRVIQLHTRYRRDLIEERTWDRQRAGKLLDGAEFFTAQHAALLKTMLAHIDRVTAGIAGLSGVIEQLLAPYEEQLA